MGNEPNDYKRVNSDGEPCAAYGRMADDQMGKASIVDQIRNCQKAADEKRWTLLEEHIYIDKGKTGTTVFDRPGFAAMMAQAKQKNPPFRRIVIDDTSRMGRNMVDVCRILDVLDYHGVSIFFASDGLDSKDLSFRDVFPSKARQDAQFSVTHGRRVRRGRIGLFEKGLNPGWSCYGYRNVAVKNETDEDARGRAATVGMREEIDPKEAAIVVRIFMLCAEGVSLRQIMVRLHAEGVPPPRKRGRKSKSCSWPRSTVDYILHNERYRGFLVYGRTTQTRNPETGKMVQQVNPESEWRRKENPELRIISEVLWDKVVAERNQPPRAFYRRRRG